MIHEVMIGIIQEIIVHTIIIQPLDFCSILVSNVSYCRAHRTVYLGLFRFHLFVCK